MALAGVRWIFGVCCFSTFTRSRLFSKCNVHSLFNSIQINSFTSMSSSPKTSQKPNDADVLFGRGNFAKFHPGNFRFRKLVGEFRSAWRATKSRKDRSNIAKKIIHEIENGHPPGKFVKFDMHTRVWQEVTFEQALIKTQKALREYVTTEEYAPDEEQRRGFDEGEQRSLEVCYSFAHYTTIISTF